MTIVLIAVNIAVFVFFAWQPDYQSIVEQYGFTPDNFKFSTLISSMFLHAGLAHLVFNMWFLWLFGDNLEDRFGKFAFVIFFFLGGTAAALIHSFVSPQLLRSIPCIGASGAISALMGGYIMLFPRARIRCWWFFFFHGGTVAVSAFLFLGFWFLGQLFSGTTSGAETTGVAFWAHIGGFVYGLVASFVLKEYILHPERSLSPQARDVQRSSKELDDIVGATSSQEEQKGKVLGEYRQVIEENFKKGEVDLAIKSYAEFETQSIVGALSSHYQRLIADTLLEQNKHLLSLQAYKRYMFNYPNDQQIPEVKCKLGLLYCRHFRHPAEGIRYLQQGLASAGAIDDQELVQQAKSELERIESLLQRTFVEEKNIEGLKLCKFAIMAQMLDERLLDQNKILTTLQSVGEVQGRNLGLKFFYDAQHNLKSKHGVILQNLAVDQADLAATKLQSAGIPVLILKQEDLVRFPLVNFVTQATTAAGVIELTTEEWGSIKLTASDILYVTLGQLPYLAYRKSQPAQDQSLFEIGPVDKKNYDLRADFNVNRVLDIFVSESRRYRINNLNFQYTAENKVLDRNKSFERFVEDLASLVGGEKIDERIKLFISHNTGSGLTFKDVKEFSDRSLWAVRLKVIYDSLLSQ
ncbi:MAG: rhomboid family intramembrane serine protease [Candidatus Omnitrophica bacterium]|nr:rhomboid family intramembrane serine protease [Candidatus Omnitrophota bacterium]